MFKFIISLSLILYGLNNILLAADQHKRDSIASLIKADKPACNTPCIGDTVKVTHLIALSTELVTSSPDSAIILSTEALHLSEKINLADGNTGWKQGIAQSNHQLGSFFYEKGDYDLSQEYFNKALSLWEEMIQTSALKYQGEKGKARTFGNLGNLYFKRGDLSKALEYHQKALSIDSALGNNKGIARHLGNIGLIYSNKGDYPKTLDFYFRAIKMDEESGNKSGVARHYGNIGNVYWYEGNYPKTLEYYLKSLKIVEDLGEKDAIASTLGNIGTLYYSQKNYPKALDYYLRALKMREELNSKPMITSSLNNIGMVYYELKDFSKALNYYSKALDISELTGNKPVTANINENIACVYFERKEYPKALDFYLKALKSVEEIGDKTAIATTRGNIGSVYVRMVDVANGTEKKQLATKAELYLMQALHASDSLGTLKVKTDQETNLSELYYFTGDFKKSIDHYRKASVLKDSLFNETKENDITQKAMTYEFEKKEAIAQAEQEKKDAFAKAELDKQKLTRNAYAGGGIMLLLLSVVLYNRNRLKQKTNKDLEEKNTIITLEKNRSEELLLNILPFETAQELKEKGSSDARQFDEVTVMFTDFKDFTQIAEQLNPSDLVADIDYCYKAFDEIIGKYNIEKIKTIGDSYMAAGGLPVANTTNAIDVVCAAQDIQLFMDQLKTKSIAEKKPYFEIRIGIHTGPVVAGIVGIKKFAYDIWGDTVNIASRMQSSGETGKTNISGNTYELVKEKFNCSHRGKIQAKNKGEIDMYFIENQI
ncbi:hypothetical protein BH11BAC1_BH11BAC1_12900 [soil metagenome]